MSGPKDFDAYARYCMGSDFVDEMIRETTVPNELRPGAINQLQTILDTDPRLYTHEQVAELVKAAHEASRFLRQHVAPLTNGHNLEADALDAALEPFTRAASGSESSSR